MTQTDAKKTKNPPVMMQRKGYWYVRLPYTVGYDEILADQRIQSGEPCIRGTRVPVSSIYGCHMAGETNAAIAKEFQITKRVVEVAIAYVEGRDVIGSLQ